MNYLYFLIYYVISYMIVFGLLNATQIYEISKSTELWSNKDIKKQYVGLLLASTVPALLFPIFCMIFILVTSTDNIMCRRPFFTLKLMKNKNDIQEVVSKPTVNVLI